MLMRRLQQYTQNKEWTSNPKTDFIPSRTRGCSSVGRATYNYNNVFCTNANSKYKLISIYVAHEFKSHHPHFRQPQQHFLD